MKIHEDKNHYTISGSYTEMSYITYELKTLGFKWDSMNRVWAIPIAQLTPVKRNKVEALVGPAIRKQTNLVDEAKAAWVAEQPDLQKLRSIHFTETPTGIIITGVPRNMNDQVRAVGGAWNSVAGGHLLQWVDVTDLGRLKKLWDDLKEASHLREKRKQEVTTFIEKGRSWPTLGVTLQHSAGGVVFSGDTRKFKDTLNRLVRGLRWDPSRGWVVPAADTSETELQAAVSFLDAEEAKAIAAKATPATAPDARTPSSRRTNVKTQDCAHCGAPVSPGDGWLYQEYDDESDKNYWKVVHKDTSKCDRIRNETKERLLTRMQHNVSVKDALRRLRDEATRSGEYLPGPIRLQGEEIPLGTADQVRFYGGGEWLVIEPNGTHFWFVQNNGADGDDWSRNNIDTGGAGAIGLRLRLTDELRALVEVARQKL